MAIGMLVLAAVFVLIRLAWPYTEGDTYCGSATQVILLLRESFVVRHCGDEALRRLGVALVLAGPALIGATALGIVRRRAG